MEYVECQALISLQSAVTYIVGLRYESVSAILCDSVSSNRSREVLSDTILKSGQIAPGIIYAYCGMIYPAQRFIIEAKDFLTGLPISDDFWQPFFDFANHHVSHNTKKDEFQLLLSERSTGKPRFHVFDSNKGFIKEDAKPPVTLGTGKALLDDVVNGIWKSKLHEDYCRQGSLAPEHFPYAFSLFLMERSQGFEVSQLQKVGVGGYFHFSYQTGDDESRQSPAVYVLADYNYVSQRIHTWIYRVSFCGPALVVECPIKNQRIIQLDSSSWPKCEDLTKNDLEKFHRDADLESLSQPYYNFLGIGMINPSLRGAYYMSFMPSDYDLASDERLVDRTGVTKPKLENILRRLISDGMKLNGS